MAESTAGPLDEALVKQASHGNADAFAGLYELYLQPVYRHIHYRVGLLADVEDLTQEVFIKAWRGIGRYRRGASPFLAWLYTIAHNVVIDYYRKKGRDHLVSIEGLIHVACGERDTELDSVLDLDVVRQFLARLPRDQQQVLMLRFVEGFDYEAVATTLGKSHGAVRVIQLRALQRLRHLMKGS